MLRLFSLEADEVCGAVGMNAADYRLYASRAYYARTADCEYGPDEYAGCIYIEFDWKTKTWKGGFEEVFENLKYINKSLHCTLSWTAARPETEEEKTAAIERAKRDPMPPACATFYIPEEAAELFENAHWRRMAAKQCDKEKFISHFKKQCGDAMPLTPSHSKKQRT